jgi:hypothetical protein
MINALSKPAYAADRCPLCGEPNACAMELEKATGEVQASCWCVNMGFTPELLAQVPPEAQGKACICAKCAQAAKAFP